MSRGSFGRSVARAAASGGSKSYRARPPVLWYAAMVVIVIVGVGLVGYSRNERLHPTTIGPTATDNWQAALGVDICGTIQPSLAANTNLTSVAIRTFGEGVINIDPAAVSTGKAAYEGANATLGKFASSYPGFKLTSTSITLPSSTSTSSTTTTTSTSTTTTVPAAKSSSTTSTTSTTTAPKAAAKTWTNGDACTSTAGKLKGTGTLEAKVWSSPTSVGKLVTSNVTKIHLSNGEMIMIAFVPKGASIPEPPSRGALLAALGSVTTSTTTTVPAASTTTTTKG